MINMLEKIKNNKLLIYIAIPFLTIIVIITNKIIGGSELFIDKLAYNILVENLRNPTMTTIMKTITKLSDVEQVTDIAVGANVLVENEGDIQRVPTSLIGAQADWNEVDENSPAFILNKPTSLGAPLYAYNSSNERLYNYEIDKDALIQWLKEGNYFSPYNYNEQLVTLNDAEENKFYADVILNNGVKIFDLNNYKVLSAISYDSDYSRFTNTDNN